MNTDQPQPDAALEKTLRSIEKRLDGVIGPIVKLQGFNHTIDLEDLTEEEAQAILDYFGKIH